MTLWAFLQFTKLKAVDKFCFVTFSRFLNNCFIVEKCPSNPHSGAKISQAFGKMLEYLLQNP